VACRARSKRPELRSTGNLITSHDSVVEVTPKTERAAYDHYGIEPPVARDKRVEMIRSQVWRIQEGP
jgi:hypothetical protein